MGSLNRSGLASLLAVAVAASLLAGGPREVRAELWSGGDQHKCELKVPESPARWSLLPVDSSWAQHGIVTAAERRLDTLLDGTKGSGQGGLLHLAIRPAPEGATLDGVAADAAIRTFLLARFVGTPPTVDVREESLNDDIPCRVLRVEGKANNLSGEEGTCMGRMLVALAHKRVYLLRMYAWPSAKDAEALGADLDFMEIDALTILDPQNALKSSDATEKPPERPPSDGDSAGATLGDGEEKRYEFEKELLVLLKHPHLAEVSDSEESTLVKFEASDQYGGYQIILSAIPYVANVARVNLSEQVGIKHYQSFLESHPIGDVWVHPWPKKPTTVANGSTFLLVPDLIEATRHVVSDEKRRKPDPEASSGELEKKIKMLDSPKSKNVGPDFKVPGPAYRSVIGGKHPSVGDQTVVKFGWLSGSHDFLLYVSVHGEGWMRYGAAIRATIESIRIVPQKKWKDRWE